MPEQIMVIVAYLFKGTTLNKKKRLEHESLRYPETRILRYHGDKQGIIIYKLILLMYT